MHTIRKQSGQPCDDANLESNLRSAQGVRWRDLLNPQNPDQSLRVIAIATALTAFVIICAAVHEARWLFMPIATAFIISILLAPAADALKRTRMPETARAGVVVLTAFLMMATGIYTLAQPAISFSERLPEIVAEARDKLTGVEDAVNAVQEVTDEVGKVTNIEPQRAQTQEVVLAKPSVPSAIAASTRLIIVQSLFVTVLSFFFLAARTDFKRKALLARNTFRGRLKAARTLRDIERNVGAYMLTMMLINFGLGVATGLAMFALGAPSPMLWGALAGLLNFLPYIGPITITVLLGLMGVVNFETGAGMAAPALIYVVLNFVESNFVTPAFVGVRLRLTPIAIILSISFWTWLWGPVGAVLSIPLLVVVKSICDREEGLKPLGVLIGELDPIHRREMRGFKLQTFAEA